MIELMVARVEKPRKGCSEGIAHSINNFFVSIIFKKNWGLLVNHPLNAVLSLGSKRHNEAVSTLRKSLVELFLCACLCVAAPVFATLSADIDNVEYLAVDVSSEINGVAFRECILRDPGGTFSRKAECTQIYLPENYGEPSAKKIPIFVALLRSSAKKKQVDPMVLIAGGPGQSATESFIFPGMGFHKVRQTRDIFLIDQRGTGKSNRLACDLPIDIDSLSKDQQVSFVKACEAELSAGSDLRQYTTSVAVRDLETVRQQLGLTQWNLYGVSYGTRVAQHYLRRYPEAVRSVVLDAVVPPDHPLGTEISLQSQRSLEQLIMRCENHEGCRQEFSNLRSGVAALMQDIKTAPKKLLLENTRTGQIDAFELTAAHLNAIVRFSLYSPELASVLPVQLHAAYQHNNFLPLARSIKVGHFDLSQQLSFGMHAAVVCSEDIAFLSQNTVEASAKASEGSYLGSEMLQSLQTICQHWPAGVVDSDFHQRVKSSVPVLLMSGSADPITPPSYAEDAAQYLSNSIHLVVEGFAHSVLRVGCMPGLLAKFVESAAVDIEPSCLKRQRPAPIFVDFNGPQP